MTDSKLVSVLLPTYNAEKYIAEAIDSVIQQEHKNVEIVISDDASSDNTPAILKEYQKKYPELIKLFLQEKNLGVTNNCNFILENCTGEFVCFFAGDDRLYQNCISDALPYFNDNNNLAIVFHKHDRIDGNSIVIEDVNISDEMETHFGNIGSILEKGGYVGANGMLVKSSFLKHIKYNKELATASDIDLILQVLKGADTKFLYLAKTLSSWRYHEASITNSRTFECFKDVMYSNHKLMVDYPEYAKYALARNRSIFYYFLLEKHMSKWKYDLYLEAFSDNIDQMSTRLLKRGYNFIWNFQFFLLKKI